MRRSGFISTALGIGLVLLLVFGAYVFFKDLDGPAVRVTPNTGRVSPATVLKITMEDPAGVRSLAVGIRRNNALNLVYSKHFDKYDPRREVDVPLKGASMGDGAFDLEIRATDASLAGFGQGNTRTVLLPMRLDTQKPRISLKNLPPNVRRGGTGVIRYTIDEDVQETGVIVGGTMVQAYLQKDGSHVCFFPFPYFMTNQEFKSGVEIMATDLAGNVTRNRLTVVPIDRKFKSDRIEVKDDFLQQVQDKLGHLAKDAADPLAAYLHINKEERQANAAELRRIGQSSASAMLWDGVFVRLPRAAPRAGFADHRFLSYRGKQIGESWHLGFDLASLRNAEVPAGNNGRVVYHGEMGIYGNLVIIDHGLGLMSLYSHLSEIHVKRGDVVKKGQIIGKTGTTGLAFGDHLHFGILVGGMEVTPLEWFDPKWIRDNVSSRIENQEK